MISCLGRNFAADPPAVYARRERDFQVTSLVLLALTLVLFSAAWICKATGLLPPTALGGLGLIATLFGHFAHQVGVVLAAGFLVTFALSCVSTCQKHLSMRRISEYVVFD